MSEESLKNGKENEGFSLALNEILSNPDMLSKISDMAEKLRGGEKSSQSEPYRQDNEEKTASTAPSLAEKFPELLGMLSGKGAGAQQSRRSELLCALKPYLSQTRVDAIDQIIRLSELSSVFKNLS